MFNIRYNPEQELAAEDDNSLYNKTCLMAGWGYTKHNGIRSAVLRKAGTMNGFEKSSNICFKYCDSKLSTYNK